MANGQKRPAPPNRPPARANAERAGARKPGKKRPAPRAPQRSLDVFHMLALVAGTFSGLWLYAVVTPGQLPTGPATVEEADPRSDLLLVGMRGGRGADGFMHVSGAIANSRDEPCRLASVTVKFFDRAGTRVADTLATVEGIAPHGRGAFEARAHAPGAVRFEADIDLAQFDRRSGRWRGRP